MSDSSSTQRPPEEPISARGWTKIVLTFVLAIMLFYLTRHWWETWRALDFQQAYIDQLNSIDEPKSPMAADGESKIGAFMQVMFCFGLLVLAAFAAAGTFVQIAINFVWHKPAKRLVERDIIHIH